MFFLAEPRSRRLSTLFFSMIILGISSFYHDSAAALIQDGKVIAANQEERFTRVKHDSSFPSHAIEACLKKANIEASQVDAIVFFEKPFLKFERLLETYLAFAPKGFSSFQKAIPTWLKEKLFQKKLIAEHLEKFNFSKNTVANLLFSEHHLSHAASAFFCSNFEEALVLTMDGVGEWETTTVYKGQNGSLTKLQELRFPHSLGLLYSAFTYHCGFKVNSGEYKLMGLAPYGSPKYADVIKSHLLDIKSDGSFKLNLDYFNFAVGLTMTNHKFNQLFENSFRNPDDELKQIHMDLAASIQVVTEEIILKICQNIHSKYKVDYLCLAGGVALNCVANGKIHELGLFKKIWIQPAAGDAGGALGAALAAYYMHFKKPRQIENPDSMSGAFLGPQFSNSEIEKILVEKKLVYQKISDENLLLDQVSDLLSQQKTVGWLHGEMEFGPRSLGHRSILADPRSAEMQKNLNLKIKFRESFRPFAPAIREEDVQDWFEFKEISPYMLMVASIKKSRAIEMTDKQKKLFGIEKLNIKRSEVPAVTHVDYSARIQTVSQQVNPRFHRLLTFFKEKTNCPILVNTSFNIRGEPIVCTPDDAIKCFFGTGLDVLVLENFLLQKAEQPTHLMHLYQNEFDLD